MIKIIKDLKSKKHFIKVVVCVVLFIICATAALFYFFPEQSLGKGDDNQEDITEVGESLLNTLPNTEEPLVIVLPDEEKDINELEEVSEEELEKLQVDKNTIKNEKNLPEYYIKVNYGANVVNIYRKDDNNEYTIPVKAMLCSTGTATPRTRYL